MSSFSCPCMNVSISHVDAEGNLDEREVAHNFFTELSASSSNTSATTQNVCSLFTKSNKYLRRSHSGDEATTSEWTNTFIKIVRILQVLFYYERLFFQLVFTFTFLKRKNNCKFVFLFYVN
jgi:hypothetical protein